MGVITTDMLEQQNEELGEQNEVLRFFRRAIDRHDQYDLEVGIEDISEAVFQDIQDALLEKIDYWIRVNVGFQRMNERILKRMERMAKEENWG